jgi:DNA recombination protein RmuC
MYLQGMESAFIIAAVVVGVVLGAAAVWPILRAQAAAAYERGKSDAGGEVGMVRERLAVAETRATESEKDLSEHKTQLAAERSEKERLQTRAAELETQLSAERKHMAEKVEALEDTEKRLKVEFENLANRIFEEKSKMFTEKNQEQIGTVLNPLREQLGDFRKKIEDVYIKENEQRTTLLAEIKHLRELNQQISTEADNLTKALKGDSQARGAWGEMILDSVLNASGLTEGREYEKQVSMQDDQGKRFRPDVIVHLPDSKDILIDSKVSLVDYEQAIAAESDEQRAACLKRHVAAVRARVSELGDKHYDALNKVNSLDYVLMFVPIESALVAVVQLDPDLYEWSMARRVLVVGPSTLLGTMRTIQNMWRSEYQSRNAQAIADRAGLLYDKFVDFVESLEEVGERLVQAQRAYDTSHGRLTSGRGNLIRQTEELRKLGAKARKQLAEGLVEEAEDDAEAEEREA